MMNPAETNQPDAPAVPTAQLQPLAVTSQTTGLPTAQRSWQQVARRSRAYGRVAALLGAILIIGGAGGYFVSLGLRTGPRPATAPVQSLTDAQLRQLGQASSTLGTSNQVLTIGANSVFQGKVNVASDLTLGGRLNANGPVSLASLAISGPTNVNTLAVGQGLQIGGLTNAQNGLTVAGQTNVNGNLAVSGAAAINNLSAGSIAVRQLQLSGPLIVSHIVTSGAPVSAAGGAALGSGGSMSVSGNDTTGTVSAAFGSGGSPGTIASVSFRSSYGATVHVIITPLTDAAAQAQAYVVRTPTGFSLAVHNVVGGPMSFDYLVVQ